MKLPLVIAPGGHLVLALSPIALGFKEWIHKDGVVNCIIRCARTVNISKGCSPFIFANRHFKVNCNYL